MKEEQLEGVGGLKIFTRTWRPAEGKTRDIQQWIDAHVPPRA